MTHAHLLFCGSPLRLVVCKFLSAFLSHAALQKLDAVGQRELIQDPAAAPRPQTASLSKPTYDIWFVANQKKGQARSATSCAALLDPSFFGVRRASSDLLDAPDVALVGVAPKFRRVSVRGHCVESEMFQHMHLRAHVPRLVGDLDAVGEPHAKHVMQLLKRTQVSHRIGSTPPLRESTRAE